ncbi:mediator of RNA polymerase II transcription subunit 30-like isoform X1 [Cotesia glomerata]|uniref:mediator of RNA polymerase II transcription subunit 30-like isoform X1 n=1 Tax=Cotesia glomerata TaxID=32391 RepID=UPI001D0081FE|nr:mediator of RNA polymerase II transcription subunit 30-like isoform X1 [Cotesia glomerata]
MAGQQQSFLPGFPAPQQQAMINQFGGGQIAPELMGPQQRGMSSGLINPQQFGAGMGGNVGPNPMAQQVMTQERQQLAQQTLMQQQLQQMQQQKRQLQQQQQTALISQNNQAVNQVQTPQPSAPPMQPQVPQQQQPQQQPRQQEFSPVAICKKGQETVQKITLAVQELYQMLKNIQPPTGPHQGYATSVETKKSVMIALNNICTLCTHLRRIYNLCNENSHLQGMEYTHIESLIPFKGEWDMKSDEKKNSEVYRQVCEERNQLIEQLTIKNRHLKEIIDHIRLITSEINIMLHMRRS